MVLFNPWLSNSFNFSFEKKERYQIFSLKKNLGLILITIFTGILPQFYNSTLFSLIMFQSWKQLKDQLDIYKFGVFW